MKTKELDVMIGGVRAGILSQDSTGVHSFRYEKEYRGVPLSSAMPLSTRTYRDKTVLPYLWGLLPEDSDVRKKVAVAKGVSCNNPFALLSVIGLDCPGAVQFCERDTGALREEYLVPASEADIAHRLALSRGVGSGWIAENEHWSLGGQQSKFALRRRDDDWYFCEGAAATTHLLKSGVRGLAHQALNEFVCMKLAAACGIDVAQVEYREFEGVDGAEPAIIIERYDRLVVEDNVIRLHQEDLAQALGCLPDNKYAMYGGPSCVDVVRLLMTTGSLARANTAHFLQMLFFDYLVAATDAHAKNYSIMLSADGAHRLAPMYDVASIAPYVEQDLWAVKPPKLAMSIGGENRVGFLAASHLQKMVNQCGLESLGFSAEGCARLILLYADIIPERLAKIFDELEGTEVSRAAEELRSRMEKPIVELCERTEERL